MRVKFTDKKILINTYNVFCGYKIANYKNLCYNMVRNFFETKK